MGTVIISVPGLVDFIRSATILTWANAKGLGLVPILIRKISSPDIYLYHHTQIVTGAEDFIAMPEELDPTTARLVSELSALMLPSLTKSLSSAIPANDFSGAIERTNRTAQDLRSEIVRAVRSATDDSRAGRSMIMQSIGTLLEEIAALRRNIDKLPEMLEAAAKSAAPVPEVRQDDSISDSVMAEIDNMSERIDTLTQGIKAFFETYAEHRENDTASIPEILRPSVDSEALSGLEGLVRAEGKTHSTELAELSREITAMTEENNNALIHEVREAVAEEISGLGNGDYSAHNGNSGGNVKLMKIIAALSGTGVILLLVNIVILMMK